MRGVNSVVFSRSDPSRERAERSERGEILKERRGREVGEVGEKWEEKWERSGRGLKERRGSVVVGRGRKIDFFRCWMWRPWSYRCWMENSTTFSITMTIFILYP